MKRLLIVVLAMGVMAGSVTTAGAHQPRRVERTVVGHYGPYPAPVTGCSSPLGSFSCLAVRASLTETSFTAKVTDTHGQPVYVEVLISPPNSGDFDTFVFCGETTRPIRIPARAGLSFHIGLAYTSLWPDCPANRVKTTGTISVTLSNRA